MRKIIRFLTTFIFGAIFGYAVCEHIYKTLDKQRLEASIIMDEEDWVDKYMRYTSEEDI